MVVFATPPFWFAKLITFALPAASSSAPAGAWTRRGRDRLAGGDPHLLVGARLGDGGTRRGAGSARARGARPPAAPQERGAPRARARARRAAGAGAGSARLGLRRLGRSLDARLRRGRWRRGLGDALANDRRRAAGRRGRLGRRLRLGRYPGLRLGHEGRLGPCPVGAIRRVGGAVCRPTLRGRPSVIFGARSAAEKSHRSRLFARTGGFPPPAMIGDGARPARQAPGDRDRQGGRRQVDRRARPRARRRPRGQADHPLRGLRPGTPLARLPPQPGRLPRGRDAGEPVGDLDRPRRIDARVRAAAAEGQADARPALPLADLHLPGGRHPGAQGAGHDREDLGAGARRPQGARRAPLRPGDRRRAGDRARGRLPADPADVREHRQGRADPPAGRDPRRASSATASGPGSPSSRSPRRCR